MNWRPLSTESSLGELGSCQRQGGRRPQHSAAGEIHPCRDKTAVGGGRGVSREFPLLTPHPTLVLQRLRSSYL